MSFPKIGKNSSEKIKVTKFPPTERMSHWVTVVHPQLFTIFLGAETMGDPHTWDFFICFLFS